jgi:hypothetical protein
VVVFVQIYPEAKKRQYRQALDAYEAAVGDQARAGRGQALIKDQGKEGRPSSGTAEPPTPGEHVIEATLAADGDGDQTILVLEERGMPVDLLAAYGAGIQVHVEDLAAHIAGRERGDAKARWEELLPAYEALTAKIN